MSNWLALHYPLRPGSEERVKELFRLSGRPRFELLDGQRLVGRLAGTMAFVGPGAAVRVIEIDGPLGLVAARLARLDAVQAFEAELEQHLAARREMTTPYGARQFYRAAAMECVLASRYRRVAGVADDWSIPITPGAGS